MTPEPQVDLDLHYFMIGAIEISIDEDIWLKKTDIKSSIEKAIATLLKTEDCGLRPDDQFSILLTHDTHIQQLNCDFRGKDKPTNVLSFPQDEGNYIGDIAISLQTIESEATEQEKDFYHHFIHMLIHGVLHLLGYDHMNDSDAEEMESLEIKILKDMGIENPYT